MKPSARFDRRRRRGPTGARGFTLIELMVAIAILALVAVLAWRGLDQIIRGREAITRAIEDERALAQLFEQLRADVFHTARDDVAGGPPITFGDGTLQIVRTLTLPGSAPRLQVVRYRVPHGQMVRYASPPLATVGQLRRALSDAAMSDWSSVGLIAGVTGVSARLFVPGLGWTAQMADVRDVYDRNVVELGVPQLGQAPLKPSVTGVEIDVSTVGAKAPYQRVLLVNQ